LAASPQRLANEGRSWGRPRRLTEEQVAEARRLQAAGRSTRQIAVALKLPRTTIRSALKRAAA
jgi:DNA invertase Pin-like site-specific DNA recombinase